MLETGYELDASDMITSASVAWDAHGFGVRKCKFTSPLYLVKPFNLSEAQGPYPL